MSNIFGSLIQSLKGNGVAPNIITEAVSAVGGAFNSTSSQVTAKLGSLAALTSNPTEYNAVSPSVIDDIEAITAQKYPQVTPLLEKLRAASDPLVVAETIAAIEQQL